MTDWQQTFAGTVEGVERRLDHLKRRLGSPKDVIVVPYRGYGSRDRLLIRGRILSGGAVPKGKAEDSLWENLLNTYRRLESDEVGGACVRALSNSVKAEAISNEEGFFRICLERDDTWRPGAWIDVPLELCSSSSGEETSPCARAEVLLPSDTARFAVISDIDDTILQSHATELLRMARLTLFGNAQTRLPFTGVGAFYRALQSGMGAENPIFYVSSSPWNLYDLLVDFFDVQDIPRGPMFLRDWGIARDELFPTEHAGHKLTAIEELFEFYPTLSFILLGDSGQHDPEIYSEVVRRYGERVKAVYIRDVNDAGTRDAEVVALADVVAAAGSTLLLADSTLTMARHAVQKGWIDADAIEAIAQERQAPPVEQNTGDEAHAN